jgi:hypothetical protein
MMSLCSASSIESYRLVALLYLLKWFYDTSTGPATGVARCGSFVGEGFGLLAVRSRWTW